ncbi:glycerol transporter [Pseudocyphellaria aurata]|nr:glycerol transporter [Pseudocyphellaria aurata]
MSALNLVGRLYAVDTLDTRFITSKTPSSNAKPHRIEKGVSEPTKSRWMTLEFYVYYLVILVAIPLMFKAAYDVSNPSHSNYSQFEHLLSPGWIAGRKVDNSDEQYSTFRNHVPYMFLLLIFHPLLRGVFELLHPIANDPLGAFSKNHSEKDMSAGTQYVEADARLNRRVTYDVYFAALFLVALHGFSAFKILLILYVNYTLVTRLPIAYVPTMTWIFNIGILFANELSNGYPLGKLADILRPLSTLDGVTSEKAHSENWGSVLDNYGGLIPRWEIQFNITVLRLISFNLDYYWSSSRAGGSPLEKEQLDRANLSERDRVAVPAKSQDYSFRNYLAYTLYAPLYLAGPIVTFNDYISQVRYKAKSITVIRTILYGIRFLICLLTMEIIIHFVYAIAISKAQPAWEVYTPFQLSMLGYFNLNHIWLKLLLLFRFFRFWALVDGIDPPENMVRCMSDNYSTQSFWRGWHRSFNRWIVRYIYIPLGGSGGPGTKGIMGKARAMLNFLAVFTFVALWHDINLRLLAWGWLITLFVLPEVLAESLFPPQKWQNHQRVYRMICGVGAVGNILMLMAANLVGFAVGLDGGKDLVRGIVGSYSG